MLFVIACVLLVGWFSWLIITRNESPPEPPGFPLIGHLHHLVRLPHRSLFALSRRYGPLMKIRLGSKTAIIISSKKAAKEVLTTYDRVFASRPVLITPEVISYGSKDIAFCEYGPYWWQMKKLCVMHLFTTKRLGDFQSIRHEETQNLMLNVARHVHKSNPVDMGLNLSSLSFNVICRMAFTKRIHEPELVEVIQEVFRLMGAVHLGDYIPWLSWLDIGGYFKRLRETSKKLDNMMQKIVDEHRAVKIDHPGDLIHTMLSLGAEDTAIKALVLDMVAAGTHSTAVTVGWAMSEIIKNQEILHEMRQEIAQRVGNDRMVEESDLQNLHYVKAVVKETLRLHPPFPLAPPHLSTEDCKLQGYKIPKGTWLIVNLFALGQDPSAWESPELFKPERFLNTSIDVRGSHFELIPFGSGRRICPGASLALIMVELTLARLVQAFDWSLPGDAKLSMEECQGLVVPRKRSLVCIAALRIKEEALHVGEL